MREVLDQTQGKKFFTVLMVRHWKRLPSEDVAGLSLEVNKGFEQLHLVEGIPDQGWKVGLDDF